MKVKTEDRIEDMKAVWMEEERSEVKMIDQRFLPAELKFYTAGDYRDIHSSIKNMMVRGAPAIGVTAAYGMAQAKVQGKDMEKAAEHIKSARPTAYDLFYAVDHMLDNLEEPVKAAKEYAEDVIEKCRKIGENGAGLIESGDNILTHCNAGALATVDYGTALAPMRIAGREGKDIHVYVDETRPRLQGARLTAWELYNEDISHSVIVDNASGHYMFRGEIDLVVVGTDRIVANGDIANKIGTYEKAVLAEENDIPFYVAAPVTTYDGSTEKGTDIPIEDRDEREVREINGSPITPEDSPVKNPAFDVTPVEYITGYITEKGVFSPSELKDMF
ncbi:MAG: S-methyl-5-thioribose-1-phosphate isomerase [Candidatus Thermoplasmatota archaeon]